MRWLSPFAVSFVITPLLVHRLGAEKYGILTIACSLVSLVGFIGVGFNDALIKHLSHARSLGDQSTCIRLIRTNLFIFVVALIFIVLLSVGLSSRVVDWLIHPPQDLWIQTQWVVILMGVNFGLALVTGSIGATISAAERYDLLALLAIGFTILIGLGQFVIAFFFPDIVLLSLWYIITTLLNMGGTVFFFRKLYPHTSWSPYPYRDMLGRLAQFSFFRILDAVFALAYFQFDRVLIGAIVGVGNLMFYSIPATLSQTLGHSMNVLTMPLVPKMSILQASNNLEAVQSIYIKTSRLITWLTVTGGSILFSLGFPFLNFWLGDAFASQSAAILQWLVIAWGTLGLGFVATNTLFGLNKPKINAACRFVQSLGGVGSIIILVPVYGVVSAGVGLAIANIVSVALLIIYTEQLIGLRLGTTFFKAMIAPAIVGILVLALGILLMPFVSNWLGLLLVAGLLAMTSVVFAVILNIVDKQELRIVREQLIHVFVSLYQRSKREEKSHVQN
jgi:O-antigen/teichoic acid export membrane protein